MAKRTTTCDACRVTFNTYTKVSICRDCQKIRFHLRKVMPDYIPLDQTRKFLALYKKKYPKTFEEIQTSDEMVFGK